jgi:hypothetical protein
MNFLKDAWYDARPSVVRVTSDLFVVLAKIAKDLIIASSLWLGVFAFHLLAHLFELNDFVAKFLLALHATTAICALVVFAFLFLYDIYHHHRQE